MKMHVLSLSSHRPWFEVFYKLLNTVGDLLAQDQVRVPPFPWRGAEVSQCPLPSSRLALSTCAQHLLGSSSLSSSLSPFPFHNPPQTPQPHTGSRS